MSKVCKRDDLWYQTLNPVLHHVYKCTTGKFAVQIIQKTHLRLWNILLPLQLTLFKSRSTWLKNLSDFQLEKRCTRPQTQANKFICLLDPVYQALFGNMKIERQGWPGIPLILGRSRTQYVALGIKFVKLKLWTIYSGILLQRIKHFWYKLAEISFFVIFDQNLVEYDVITWLIWIL